MEVERSREAVFGVSAKGTNDELAAAVGRRRLKAIAADFSFVPTGVPLIHTIPSAVNSPDCVSPTALHSFGARHCVRESPSVCLRPRRGL